MPRRCLLLHLLILVVLPALSCSNPFRSDWQEVVGLVNEHMLESGEVLQVPAQSQVNSSVLIQITTGGSGNCTRTGRTGLDWVTSDSAVITPFDETKWGSGAVCNLNFASFPRTVSLGRLAAGKYAISVRARVQVTDFVSIVTTRHVQVY